MHLPSPFKHLCAALALACALPATAAVIDFDDDAAPMLFTDAMPLGAEYQHLGVTFSGASGVGGAILNQEAEVGFLARSGSNFLAFERDAGFGTDERISFATVQSAISLFAATLDDKASFSLSAFDGLGNLLGSTSIAASRDWQELTLAFSGIRSVVVSSTAFGWSLDDLSFTAAPAEVPEPATVGLIGMALAGLMAARRRRRA